MITIPDPILSIIIAGAFIIIVIMSLLAAAILAGSIVGNWMDGIL